MKTGTDVLNERAKAAGITLGTIIEMEVFDRLGLPMIVACTHCEMTLAFPNAVVGDGHTFCQSCAECLA